MALKLGYNENKWKWKPTTHIMTESLGYHRSLCRMVNTRAQPHIELQEFDREKATCKECIRIFARELTR